MEIGQRILTIMEENNISYRDLEKATGISRSTLNRYAAKGKAIPLDKLDVIAKALGTDTKTLMGWNVPDQEDETMRRIMRKIKTMSHQDLIRLEAIIDVWTEE